MSFYESQNIFIGSTGQDLFLQQFEERRNNTLFITDYKGDLYQFYRRNQTFTSKGTYEFKKIVSEGIFEKAEDRNGKLVDIIFRMGVKRKKSFTMIMGVSTIKFNPAYFCEKECVEPKLEVDDKDKTIFQCKQEENPKTCFQTCKHFARNDKGSSDYQKQNKRILSNWEIKQKDLTEEMEKTVTREKIIYQTKGYSMTRVYPTRPRKKHTKTVIKETKQIPSITTIERFEHQETSLLTAIFS